MPTFVLMTKLSASSLQDRRSAGRDWLNKVQKLCPGLKWVAHYALLGPYDFMDVYRAKNEDMAFRVSLLSRELGAVTAESWPAIEYEDYLPIADKVEAGANKKKKKRR